MKKDIFIVGTYSVIHFIVDMMCGIIMMALVSPLVKGTNSYVISFLLYNLFLILTKERNNISCSNEVK